MKLGANTPELSRCQGNGMQCWASSRSPRNASGIHGCYPEVPQKRKPGAHLHPSLLQHAAASTLNLPVLRKAWSCDPVDPIAPRRHSKLLPLTPHLPYKDTALSMGRHSRCQQYCTHRACSSGNPGSQTGSDRICLLHNLPYKDTDLATSLGEKTATLIHHEVPGLKAGAGEHRQCDLFEQNFRYSWLNRALFLSFLLLPHSHGPHPYANVHSFLCASKTVCRLAYRPQFAIVSV